jgi:hypothetical protein
MVVASLMSVGKFSSRVLMRLSSLSCERLNSEDTPWNFEFFAEA